MINEKWIQNFATALKSAKYDHESYYLSDENIAEAFLEHTVEVLESYLNRCLNIQDGRCYTWWKHEECLQLQGILYDITENDKYMSPEMLDWYRRSQL